MNLKPLLPVVSTGMFLLAALALQAAPQVTMAHNNNEEADAQFSFKDVPSPSSTDAASSATITLVEGEADPNGGGLDKLQDGRLPDGEDAPADNFFFAAGTDGGRLLVDLGKVIKVRQVNTYSWHADTRAPQKYLLYGSEGMDPGFVPAPKSGAPPVEPGWKLIATVDTTAKWKDASGQYGVSVADPAGILGKYRYLLFDVAAAERNDAFGNTFYSELDVVDADAPPVTNHLAGASAAALPLVVKTADGLSEFTINTTKAPQLRDWAEKDLAPVLAEWYPKIAALLPSDGYTAPAHFKITLQPMDGVAYTAGTRVVANSAWLEKEIHGEAVGSLVHEAVHVVQQFGHHPGNNPGWLVEGSADYVRWFKYEPQSHGADIVWLRHLRHPVLRYDGSYRVTANFLDWVSQKYDPQLVTQMNAAMRDGKYADDLWKQYTGKTAPELGEEWKTDVEGRLKQAN